MTTTFTLARNNVEAEADTASCAPEPGSRIILLSGSSRLRGSSIRMDGTLFGSDSGAIEGEILWTNIDTPGFSPGLAGTELVRGLAGPMDLNFQGYLIDRPFTLEFYRLALYGAAGVGVFSGTSEAFGVRECCCLVGTYQVVIERG